MGVYIDLPNNGANIVLEENVVEYPFAVPNNGNTKLFNLTYSVAAANYTDAAIGSTDANAPSAYLVSKGPLKKRGGVIQYQRSFMQVPATWGEKEQVPYSYPGLSANFGTWDPYGTRKPITLFANATVTHEYSQGSAPDPNAAFIVTDNGVVVDYIGLGNPDFTAGITSPAAEPTNYTVSSEVRLVRGNIWERITKTVPKPV